jgi:two-component system, NtrC family, sensor histidine kinase PilS
MRKSERTVFLQNEPERLERMQRIVVGRLALIVLLLLASWWWNGSYLRQETGAFPTSLFSFFLVSISLTGVYHVFGYFNRNYLWQTRIQFSIDVLLITWLVGETGNIDSPYTSLYIVLVCLSGFMLGKAESLVIAFGSALSFVTLSVVTGKVILYSISGSVAAPPMIQMVGLNTIAILFVGLLAARIGERKRIAEQLRMSQENFADLNVLHERIVQSLDTGLITTDLEGKIYDFNRAAESITGHDALEIIGRRISDVFGGGFAGPVGASLGAVQTEEYSTRYFEARLKHSDGRDRAFAASLIPLFHRAGNVSGLIVAFRDISEIRALEDSLRRADRLAAVGRMAAGLAHEIRNPLGSLSSSLQFIREKSAVGSPHLNLFDVVLREAERLNQIIANFLEYARPSSDNVVRSANRGTDIDAALRDCLVLLKHDPRVSDAHELVYESPSRPLESKMSETQLKQVVWNLLQNSIDAMPDGGNITVKLNEIPGGRVRMLFQDSGPGFSPENVKHLFEPFSVAATGTGLGLSIVHKIVSENGGRIDVGAADKGGAKILVELPA